VKRRGDQFLVHVVAGSISQCVRMRSVVKTGLVFGLIIFMIGCRDPFIPDFKSGVNDYLIVEGYVNVGEKAVTRIILSRLSPLGLSQPLWETDAEVMIENLNNETFPLHEDKDGRYVSDSLNLDPSLQYRLLLTTADGRQYASAFVQPIITPPIDSIHWQWEDDGVQLYVTTHDLTGNTSFYKWTYDETWEIRSDHWSYWEYKNDEMVRLTALQTFERYFCWMNNYSTAFNFTSTEKYSSDFIHYPLINFGYGNPKLLYEYSVLVRQRALTEAEYNHLYIIQKNTTVTGSLFDPMPGELHGNITSLTSSGEQVIGYIGACTTVEKRLIIKGEEIGIQKPALCEVKTVGPDSLKHYFDIINYIPLDTVPGTSGSLFEGAYHTCMDCRLRGSPVRPPFFSD
jgi:hypothetical protein